MREFIVHIASNGIDGWNQFKELKPDVCIIDVVLPRKDGFALKKQPLAAFCSMPAGWS